MESCKVLCSRIPQRWVFAVMGSLASVNMFTMRICLSLAITQMVVPRNTVSNGTTSDTTCPTPESISSSSHNGGTYEWDEYTQGLILSSFFWGYIIMLIPGGILVTKIGGKDLLGLSIFSTAIFTLVTPAVVEAYGAKGLIILRVLTGCGEGVTLPALGDLLAQWAPPHERSKITTVVMTGSQLGSILATALSGVLIQESSIGWPMVFYVFGAASIIWFLVWILLGYSHPDEHPFISDKEKNYLHEAMKEHTFKQVQPTPWRHMLTSVPLWALVAGKAGRAFGWQMMSIDLPKYMSDVLKLSIKANGFLTAIPNVAMWVVGNGSSWLADWLIKHDHISRTNARKIFTTIASLGPATFIIAASYAGCDQVIVAIFFTIGMALMGPSYPGVLANIFDLSPNYSGSITAIMTIVGSLCGMLAPYVVGILTPNQALHEWRIAFWICSGIFCMSTLIFNLWADGEVQYWNDLNTQDERLKNSNLKEEVPFIEASAETDNI